MKKIFIFLLCLVASIAAFADSPKQIYLWKDGKILNTNGNNYVVNSDLYWHIYDSLTDIRKAVLNERMDESDPDYLPTLVNDVNFMINRRVGVLIDSIAWHPYAVDSLTLKDYDNYTLPLRTLYGEDKSNGYFISFRTNPIPEYASINSCSIQSSDPTVAQVSVKTYTFNEAFSSYGIGNGGRIWVNIYPQNEGSTDITLTVNGIAQTIRFNISSPETVNNEETLALDSLYNKIYSRLVMPGDNGWYSDFSTYDKGVISFYRSLFNLQEFASDQLFWVWYMDEELDQIVGNNFSATNIRTEMFFHRLYYNIWLCNSYLSRADESLSTKIAEIRFLRAYFYYYLLDMYGQVPIVTDNTKFTVTPQSSRAELYSFIEQELIATEQALPQTKQDYYSVDKTAAQMLLSRLYLNAEVYAGITEYSKAANYAYKVIDSQYALASKYHYLFMADNDMSGTINDAHNEIVFAIKQEGRETASYCGANMLISAAADKFEVGTTDNNWACITSRSNLIQLFFPQMQSPVLRENYNHSNNSGEYSVMGDYDVITVAAQDDRALFANKIGDKEWSFMDLINNSGASYYEGWAIRKWLNIRADGQTTSDAQYVDTDIPLMRKAEAYLNYAEAVLRGGATQGSLNALEAVNIIRRRASATELNTLTLDDIIDERGREFYYEGYRRTDLIRFNKFGGNTGYNWELKSLVVGGKDFPEYMNLYPIPATYLKAIPNAKQNEGY